MLFMTSDLMEMMCLALTRIKHAQVIKTGLELAKFLPYAYEKCLRFVFFM